MNLLHAFKTAKFLFNFAFCLFTKYEKLIFLMSLYLTTLIIHKIKKIFVLFPQNIDNYYFFKY
jgi:hypothetical protein